jgi:hypothetical protein
MQKARKQDFCCVLGTYYVLEDDFKKKLDRFKGNKKMLKHIQDSLDKGRTVVVKLKGKR